MFGPRKEGGEARWPAANRFTGVVTIGQYDLPTFRFTYRPPFLDRKKKKKETFSLCRILSNRRIFFSLSLSLFLDGINVIRRRSYKLSSIRKKGER